MIGKKIGNIRDTEVDRICTSKFTIHNYHITSNKAIDNNCIINEVIKLFPNRFKLNRGVHLVISLLFFNTSHTHHKNEYFVLCHIWVLFQNLILN